MNKIIKTRDVQITRAVLRGYLQRQVADLYGISQSRVRQIVIMVCRKVAPRLLFIATNGRWISGIKIKDLRKYKNRFISKMNEV